MGTGRVKEERTGKWGREEFLDTLLLLTRVLLVRPSLMVVRMLLVDAHVALLESEVGGSLLTFEREVVEDLRVEREGAGGDEGREEDDHAANSELDASDLLESLCGCREESDE